MLICEALDDQVFPVTLTGLTVALGIFFYYLNFLFVCFSTYAFALKRLVLSYTVILS